MESLRLLRGLSLREREKHLAVKLKVTIRCIQKAVEKGSLSLGRGLG